MRRREEANKKSRKSSFISTAEQTTPSFDESWCAGDCRILQETRFAICWRSIQDLVCCDHNFTDQL